MKKDNLSFKGPLTYLEIYKKFWCQIVYVVFLFERVYFYNHSIELERFYPEHLKKDDIFIYYVNYNY